MSCSSLAVDDSYAKILNLLKQLDNTLVNAQLAPSANSIPEGEMLFLSFYIGNNYLGEVVGVKSRTGAWLELTSFFDSLDFAIRTSSEGFDGWFIEPSNHFSFVQPFSQAEVLGAVHHLKPIEIYKEEDDLYVDWQVLAAWFNLELDIDYGAQEARVTSKHVLPIEAKIDRTQRLKRQFVGSQYATKPWKASPYSLFSSPLADVQLGYRKSHDIDATNYSILGAHDFAYLSSQYYIAGHEGDLLDQARLTFSRESEQGKLFGPLKATQVEFGDIVATRVASLHRNQLARGIKISNVPLNTLLDQNRISISGEVQNGWDVELYQNGVLVEQQFDSTDGRYLFENINLLVGLNEFEIILYGPQGQVEKHTKQHFIDGSALDSGEAVYEVSLSEQGHRLFDDKQYQIGSLGWLLSTRYEQGLSDTLSVYGATSLREGLESGPKHVLSMGSNTTLLDRFLLNVNYEQDDLSQSRFELVTRAKILNQAVRLQYNRLSKRTLLKLGSQEIDTSSNLGIEFSGNFMSSQYGRLSYRNIVTHTNQQSGGSSQSFGNSLNYTLGKYAIGNQLKWTNPSLGTLVGTGSTQIQARFGQVYSRFSVDYKIKPDRDITGYSAEVYTNLLADVQAQLTYTSSIENDLDTTKLALSWQTGDYSINTSMSYNNDDEWQFGVFGRFSVGYDAVNNSYFTSRRSLAQSGSALIRVFLDDNDNGQLDEGEKPVEGVKVRALQAHRTTLTSAQGSAELTGLLVNRKTDVVLDKTSINEPFVVPRHQGVSITPRAGYVEYIDFPLVNASEVEGNVYIEGGKILPYAQIKLLDDSGAQVAQTEAAYDGYYLFTDLKPGNYTAKVDDTLVQRKNLKTTAKLEVELSAQGSVLSNVDFSLKEMDKIQGLVASLGVFSSLPILKTYFALVNERLSSLEGYSPFYYKAPQSNQYILAFSFSAESRQKQAFACERVSSVGLPCSVKQTLIHY
ncbi:hypothetical protein PA25_10360 [Pseudoalteromonas sp. A25]|uniref:MSCRAMM family protein n=1 Tax=Pseudoalteromonas sp. A25 TaxID=116092 RepID=UPI0012613218|nr:hypothetical protein [Pseudoalteromonas sp. A25]BBN81051.1 hypothetical protein PA25_10360 [Pseudoalteromonas sp. A25]